jgi:hypothetical protein
MTLLPAPPPDGSWPAKSRSMGSTSPSISSVPERNASTIVWPCARPSYHGPRRHRLAPGNRPVSLPIVAPEDGAREAARSSSVNGSTRKAEARKVGSALPALEPSATAPGLRGITCSWTRPRPEAVPAANSVQTSMAQLRRPRSWDGPDLVLGDLARSLFARKSA